MRRFIRCLSRNGRAFWRQRQTRVQPRAKTLTAVCILTILGLSAASAALHLVFLPTPSSQPYLTCLSIVALAALICAPKVALSALLLTAAFASAVAAPLHEPASMAGLMIFLLSGGLIVAAAYVLKNPERQVLRLSGDAASWRAFIDQAPAAMIMLDTDMRVLAVSELWLRQRGLIRGKVIGQSLYDLHPQIPESWKLAHRRALGGEIVVNAIERSPLDMGPMLWVRWEARPWQGIDGTIGGVTIFAEDATEQVLAQQALEQSEAKFRSFFQHVGVGAAITQPDGTFIEVSDSFCALLGYDRSELVGKKTTHDLTHPADRERDYHYRGQQLAGTLNKYSIEKRYVRKNGTIIWVRGTASTSIDASGKVDRIFGTVEDITDRRRSEQELHESRTRLRALISATSDAIYTLSADMKQLQQVDGYLDPSRAALPSSTWLETFVDRRDLAMVRSALAQALEKGTAFELEHRCVQADGTVWWALTKTVPLRDQDGRIIEWIGTAKDVTRTLEADRKLKESQENLRLAVSAANIATWTWDLGENRLLWSDEHYRQLGYAPGSVTPSYETWLARVFPDDVEMMQQFVHKVLKESDQYRVEYRILGPRDEVRWAEAYGKLERDEHGRVTRLYGVTLDVTDRVRSDEHAELLLKEVNHRAKNLLAVVQSIAQLTMDEKTGTLRYSQYADRLVGLAKSHDLIIASGWQGVAIADLVRSQLSHLEALIGTRILVTGPPEATLTPTAAQIIGMVIHELATNAVKYGALSNREGRIEFSWHADVEAAEQGRWLHLTWKERGGPAVGPPLRFGFGHTVLVEMPEHTLKACVALNYDVEGFAWHLTLPPEGAFSLQAVRNNQPDAPSPPPQAAR